MILTIGNSGSYEVEAYQSVVDILRKHGQEAVLFKQDQCLKGETFTFSIENGEPQLTVVIDGHVYDVRSFDAVWNLKPHLPKELMMYEPAEHRVFIERQFFEMRRAVWSLLRDKRWIDDPFAVARAENKILQLQCASEAGLTLPDTVITSEPDAVRVLLRRSKYGVVVKTLAVSPMYGKVVYTNLVTEEHLKRLDTLRLTPAIFQSRVPKSHELRITVVGEKIFAACIHSQGDEATALDWRREPKLNDYSVRMESTMIPEYVEHQLRTLMHILNLRFGCIDMIVTPEGRYVFLEINPNGQWFFVQLRTGDEIAAAIAHLLL